MAHIWKKVVLGGALLTVSLTIGCEKPHKDEEKSHEERQDDRWSNRTMPENNNRKPESERKDDRDWDGRWDHRDANDTADRWGSSDDQDQKDSSPWGGDWKPRQQRDKEQPMQRENPQRSDRGQTQRWVQGPNQYRRYNVVHIVDGDRELSTLAHALKVAGLDDNLSEKGPFTIFAPTNDAFNKLPSGKLESLLKPENRDELRKILKYHVVAGEFPSDELDKVRSLRSEAGQSLSVRVRNGRIYIDDAEVEGVDAQGVNGVVHVVDKVLMPH